MTTASTNGKTRTATSQDPAAKELQRDPDQTVARFHPGQVVSTPAALDELARAGLAPLDLLKRHLTGDWGDLDQFDWLQNELAITRQLRILSCYQLATGVKVWLITEADRSATTFLLPGEY